MIPGLRGSLVSHDALEAADFTRLTDGPEVVHVRRWLAQWHAGIQREAGPTWPARAVFDRVAAPLCRTFGLEVVPVSADGDVVRAVLRRNDRTLAALLVTSWGRSAAGAWRHSVRTGLESGTRWCLCVTGPALAVFDAVRTHARRSLELELAALAAEPATFAVASRLLSSPTALDEAVTLSDRHRVEVRGALQAGVREALGTLTSAFMSATRRRPADASAVLDDSLVVIHRMLFLLFAEARGLVPIWHPVFREGYTLDALQQQIETLPHARGVWEALQAIARLAHRGCRAGGLRVPPFNGRLFSPVHAPLAESVPLDDGAVRSAVVALTTRHSRGGRRRIAYADLGVEQLGGVYERLLEYDLRPAPSSAAPALVPTGRRKATGTFYTPRSLTEYLVRRTLAPLVREATPDDILALRVLDPAMGSGAFLVAACRYLAGAYEAALVRRGDAAAGDLTDHDRAGFRRTIAQRTIFGVDLNPMAVQLARLSLWLATLSGDRPLTFFDHHLRTGNSLVGATVADVRRRTAGARRTPAGPLPLLDDTEAFDRAMVDAVAAGATIRDGSEDTVDELRVKESLFARLQSANAPLRKWKRIADLWCAGWFDAVPARISPATIEALIDTALGQEAGLPEHVAERLLAGADAVAARQRFFHWDLEFPEVFYGPDGATPPNPGFDAVLGNPPWEMLRGDFGDERARQAAAATGARLTRFARDSGVYRVPGSGQANLYQFFVERGLALLRDGGRLGLVLPSGFAADHGCAALRRHVFGSTRVDSFVTVDNRDALFPIHRGLRFGLMTLTRGGATTTVPLRAGIREASEFDRLPDDGPDPAAVFVSRGLIEQLSGDQLAIPDIRSAMDVRIAGRIGFGHPAAGDPEGWGLRFGRELNATDDRPAFNQRADGLPVVEGKQVEPFAVRAGDSRNHIRRDVAARLLRDAPFDRPRLAYRDVASSTNRLTLIAAILPAGTVSTHTLFCLKTPLDDESQQFVLAMFNSLIANYLVRLRVTTHVTVSIVERLPLPRPERSSREFAQVVALARRLGTHPADAPAMARLHAAAARLYGSDADEFAHVLSTFPLVDATLRTAALEAFIRTV